MVIEEKQMQLDWELVGAAEQEKQMQLDWELVGAAEQWGPCVAPA